MNEGLKMKYFVLNPTSSDPAHALASIVGVMSYALAVHAVNPVQAQETYDWAKGFLFDMVDRGLFRMSQANDIVQKLTGELVKLHPEFRP